jgi:HK97 family phage prohead protease
VGRPALVAGELRDLAGIITFTILRREHMSLKQFERWLRGRGIEQHNGKYYIPCTGAARAAGTANTLTVTISTSAQDRHGDILDPQGCDLAAFRKNPVVLWAHHYDEFPIARAGEVWIENGRLVAKITFDSSPFAQEAYRLYAEGFLAAWSVGCLPRQWKVIEDEEGRFAGYHITEWELIEFSAVPVPANPEALTRELRGGNISDSRLCKELGDAISSAGARHEAPVPNAAEISVSGLAERILPRFVKKLREWAAIAAEKEIRRRQGRSV